MEHLPSQGGVLNFAHGFGNVSCNLCHLVHQGFDGGVIVVVTRFVLRFFMDFPEQSGRP